MTKPKPVWLLLRRVVFGFGVLAQLSAGRPISDREVLGEADARIDRYRKGDIALRVLGPSGEPVGSGINIHIEQTRHKFLFGANLFKFGKLDSPAEERAYEKYFAELLNYATLPFYWRAYEPERGKPQYAETDAALSWCEQHGITAKGHTLAWNLRDPPWLPPDRGEVQQLLFGRVRDCVSQFRGRINIWDVVNELTEYDRPRKVSDAPLQSAVIRGMGPGPYARTAFNTAREANSDAVLVINDYLLGPRFIEVLAKLQEGGRPAYDVIGLQAHQHHGVWPPAKIWSVCDRFEGMGRPVHITETTILSGQLQSEGSEPGRWDSTPGGEQRQAAEVERFYTVAFSHPAVEAITWWDLTDRGAWKKAPAGLLRNDMTPKPAYDVLMRLIKNKWWTRADKPANDKGEVRLRGFYGTYKITAITSGRESTGQFSFDKGASKLIVVQLN